MYIVYILRFLDNTLYIGQTNNLEESLKQHEDGAKKSSKFAKDHGAFKLAHQENFATRLESMRRENS